MPAVNSGKTSEQLSAFYRVKSITSSQPLLTTLVFLACGANFAGKQLIVQPESCHPVATEH